MLSAAVAADALLAPLAGEPALLLAVSGGPDSVALMLLAAQWSARPAEMKIAVATVDHGLREGSREEASRVGAWAGALGFEHHLLMREGPRPKSRIQEIARSARYALLCARARAMTPQGAIVTAHHADDQAETVLFRLTRGSGLAGLAGMKARSTQDGVKLLRPLLGTPKSALEALCVAEDHPFFRDPSNENRDFARARLRALRATLRDQGLETPTLLRLGRRAGAASEALEWAAARLGEAARLACEAEEARFSSPALREAPRELIQRVLAADFRRRGAPAPQLERLERAAEKIAQSLRDGPELRVTLAGVLIRVDDRIVSLTPAPPRFRRAAQPRTEPLKRH
jgi:tRNA(Ile)-lysidine synthase